LRSQARTAKGFAILSIFFFLFIIPVERLASRETDLVGPSILGRINTAKFFTASTIRKYRHICAGTITKAGLFLEEIARTKICHARA
jgi:hypothetical protein